MMIKDELKRLGLKYINGDMGVGCCRDIGRYSVEQRIKLRENLMKSGLELLEDKKNVLIERINNVIIEMIYMLMNNLK